MANDRPLAPDPSQVTRLLIEANAGDRGALNDLFPLVYDQLRGLARARLRSERPDHTLNTTALVHEAYLKLVDQKRAEWRNRAHFFAIASQAMRRILIDYARMKNAAKRGAMQCMYHSRRRISRYQMDKWKSSWLWTTPSSVCGPSTSEVPTSLFTGSSVGSPTTRSGRPWACRA